MIDVKSLEIHAAHSCNLSCKYCTHYSDNNHKGILSLDDAESWMGNWSSRIKPGQFSILGGEPCLNKNLVELLIISRKHWPNSKIIIVSNGFLLNRHPKLEETLIAQNIQLEISIHSDSREYTQKLVPVREYLMSWSAPIVWRRSYERWWAMYQGFGETMSPFADGNPRASWEICGCKYCPQLLDGSIWKCPNIAYLRMQLTKFNLHNSDKWQSYLQYRPLSPSCTDSELAEFFSREQESICNMCPATRHAVTNLEKNPLKLPILKQFM